jgi:hypothetical protein
MKKIINKIFNVDTLIMPSDVEFMKIDSDSVWASFEDLRERLYIQDGLVYSEEGDRICTTMELEQFDEFAELNKCITCGGSGEYYVTDYDQDAPFQNILINCYCEKPFEL